MATSIWDDGTSQQGLEASGIGYTDPNLQYAQMGIQAAGYGFDYAMNSENNETRKEIAREANELQLQMHRDDIANQRYLMHNTQAWNSLQSQVQRARAAGFSPSALLGSQGFNSSSSGAPSVPQSLPVQRPEITNPPSVGGVGQAFADIMLANAQHDKLLQEAEGQSIDNRRKDRKNISEIHKNEAAAAVDESEAVTNDLTLNSRIQSAAQQAYKMAEEARKQKLDADLQALRNQIASTYEPKTAQKQFDILVKNYELLQQEIRNKVKEGLNLDATRQYIRAQTWYQQASAQEKENYNRLFDDTYEDQKAIVHREGYRAKWDTWFDENHYLDEKYMNFTKSQYSVDSAREMVKQLQAQRKLAEKQNMYYEANMINTYINTLNQGIRTAQNGRFTDEWIRASQKSHNGYTQTITRRAYEDGWEETLERRPFANQPGMR